MKTGKLSDPLTKSIDILMPTKLGLHLRVAAQFVMCIQAFRSNVRIKNGDRIADGKSVMGLLILGASWKSKLEIEAIGDDAVQTIESIKKFFLDQEDLASAA